MARRRRYPSAATITRARFYTDVGYMLWMRGEHDKMLENDCILYGCSDSSPQGGRNWLMIEYCCVQGALIPQLANAVFAMQSAHTGLWCDGLDECMKEWQATIMSSITKHKFPPTALGQGHSGHAHKVQATLHAMRLESNTWEVVIGLKQLEFSHCADRGTESEMHASWVPIPTSCPHWFSVPLDASDVLVGDAPPPLAVDMTTVLDVPGTYHAIDNMQKRIDKALPEFDVHVERFQIVARVFHQPHTREVFVHQCLGNMENIHFLFKDGPPLYEGGRAWGVTYDITEWILKRHFIIRTRWNLAKMSWDKVIADTAKTGKMIRAANDAIVDQHYWAFLYVQYGTSGYLKLLLDWCVSCPCHGGRFASHFDLKKDRVTVFEGCWFVF